MNSRLITARFSGKCRKCERTVVKGEPVYFAKHFGIRCEACGPHDPSDPPLPSKRGSRSKSPRQRRPEPSPSPLPADSPEKAISSGRMGPQPNEDLVFGLAPFQTVRAQDYSKKIFANLSYPSPEDSTS